MLMLVTCKFCWTSAKLDFLTVLYTKTLSAGLWPHLHPLWGLIIAFFQTGFEDHVEIGREGRERQKESVNDWDMQTELPKLVSGWRRLGEGMGRKYAVGQRKGEAWRHDVAMDPPINKYSSS